MKHISKPSVLAAAVVATALATAACDRQQGADEQNSSATGERNQRLGNDPAEQNTGRGSNPSEEITPPAPPAQ